MNRTCHRSRIVALLVVAVLQLANGCGDNQPPSPGNDRATTPDSAAQPPAATVVISAAASTKEAVEELARQYEQQQGVQVSVNVGASNTLAAQIINGAPTDLFLSASSEWITAVADAGLLESRAVLLLNSLVIITPRGNPAGIHTPQDLVSPAVQHLALAGERVPAGQYADQALRSLNLSETLIARQTIVRGQDVRVALSYVERGEAEAGIVYATDAQASRNVQVVHTFDESAHGRIVYELGRIRQPQSNAAADSFYRFLLSDKSDPSFLGRGFRRPLRPSHQLQID